MRQSYSQCRDLATHEDNAEHGNDHRLHCLPGEEGGIGVSDELFQPSSVAEGRVLRKHSTNNRPTQTHPRETRENQPPHGMNREGQQVCKRPGRYYLRRISAGPEWRDCRLWVASTGVSTLHRLVLPHDMIHTIFGSASRGIEKEQYYC